MLQKLVMANVFQTKIGSQCNKLAMVNIPWRKGKNEQVHRVWAKVPQEITLIFWNGLYLSLEII